MSQTGRAAAALAVATVALRLPRALGASFWQDEVASARVVREPSFSAMLHQVVRTESTPPLWYALAWIVHRTGVSIHDLRLLSVAFDAGLVALVVVLGAKLLPLSCAVAGGVVVSVGAQFSGHGRELRAYELFALLTVGFALALHGAAMRPSQRRLVLLGAATAAGLLTHYFFAFSLAAGVAWLWLEPAARVGRLRATAAIAAGGAAFAPWLPMFVAQYRHDRFSWIGQFDLRVVAETPLRLFSPAVASLPTAVAFLLVLSVATGLAVRRGSLARLLAALAVLPLLLAAATWLAGFEVFAVRNLIATGPFVAIVVLLPLAGAPVRRRAALTVAVSCAAAAGYVWVQRVPDPPFRGIAAALVSEGWRPWDPVLVAGSPAAYRSPLEWYLPHTPRLVQEPWRRLLGARVFAVLGRRRVGRLLADDAKSVGAFVVARLDARDALPRLRDPVLLVAARAAHRRRAHPLW